MIVPGIKTCMPIKAHVELGYVVDHYARARARAREGVGVGLAKTIGLVPGMKMVV